MNWTNVTFALLIVALLPLRAVIRRRHGGHPAASGVYLVETLSLIAILFLLLRDNGIALSAVGLRAPDWRAFAWHALAGILAIMSPDVLAAWLRRHDPATWNRAVHQERERFASLPSGKQVIGFLPVCVVGAFWEELCFRGVALYVFPTDAIGRLCAVVVSSVVFGAQHLRGGLLSACFTGLFGAAYCVMYLITGDLPAMMFAHALSNLAVVVYFAPRARMGG